MPCRLALAGALALVLAAPAHSETRNTPLCTRGLAAASASLDSSAAKLKSATATDDVCSMSRLHFVDAIKARAVTAQCKSGHERDQELMRLDLAVDALNTRIAQSCS